MRALQQYASLRVPSGWGLRPFGEFLELAYGQSLPEQARSNSGFPVYGSNGIVGYHATGTVPGPGVVVGRKGTAGAITWSSSDFSPIDTTYFVRTKSPDTDLRWVFHSLTLANLPRLAAATGVPGLSREDVYKILFPLPPAPEQTRIADILSKMDSAVTSALETIAKMERLQHGLMQHLLTGRLKPDGTPRTKDEFWVHPKAGIVPRGWEVAPLRRLADIRRGKFSHRPRNEPRFYGGPYPFIQTGDVSNSRGYIVSHAQTLSEEGIRISRRFPKGTIFISIVGVNVAATAIASYDVYATDSVIGMIPNPGIVSEYLEFYLRSVQQKLAVLAGDSARENLNYGILKPLLVKYPSDPKEQRQSADILCCGESLIRAKEQKIEAMRRLKKSLMKNLLTGRIRLPLEGATKKEAKQ